MSTPNERVAVGRVVGLHELGELAARQAAGEAAVAGDGGDDVRRDVGGLDAERRAVGVELDVLEDGDGGVPVDGAVEVGEDGVQQTLAYVHGGLLG